jgi:hypothetical protein
MASSLREYSNALIMQESVNHSFVDMSLVKFGSDFEGIFHIHFVEVDAGSFEFQFCVADDYFH